MSDASPKPEIDKLDSRIVYENRWMRVREDSIVRASGATGTFGVVEKPDFVVVAALQDGVLHLVEQYRYPVGARYWEFPQGASEEPGMSSIELAALELREEAGLVAASIAHAGRMFPSYGYSTPAFDVYLATGLSNVGAQPEPEEEGMITRSFPLAEVERMIVDGTLRDALTVAAFGLLRLKGLL